MIVFMAVAGILLDVVGMWAVALFKIAMNLTRRGISANQPTQSGCGGVTQRNRPVIASLRHDSPVKIIRVGAHIADPDYFQHP